MLIPALPGLLLLLSVGPAPGGSGRVPAVGPHGRTVERKVKAIRNEARRIDGASEASAASRRRLSADLPHAQLTGLFEGSTPVLLTALFTEGNAARSETHYLLHGSPILVEVETWWDVDDPSRAPEPPARQRFYLEGSRTIRHVTEVRSSPPTSRADDTNRPATALVERSRQIAAILLGTPPPTTVPDSLRAFPVPEPP